VSGAEFNDWAPDAPTTHRPRESVRVSPAPNGVRKRPLSEPPKHSLGGLGREIAGAAFERSETSG
jgi:hypothetical protein